MIFVRLLCCVALLCVVQAGDCSLTSVYFCHCSSWLRDKIWLGWHRSDSRQKWSCDKSPELWLSEMVDENETLDAARRILQEGKANDLCDGNDLNSFGHHSARGSGQPHRLEINLNSSRWCASESSMPAMLSPSCQRNEFHPIKFQLCLKSVPGVFETMCSGRFLVCAIWVGQNPVIFTYLFAPTAALLVLVLMHCVAQLCSASLADVEENKPLRSDKTISCL